VSTLAAQFDEIARLVAEEAGERFHGEQHAAAVSPVAVSPAAVAPATDQTPAAAPAALCKAPVWLCVTDEDDVRPR
jgi:hypothetical protein